MPRTEAHKLTTNRPTTLKDIAAHVGVSNMTVSAVLGSSPSRHVRVSEATRTRVIEAARQMHYRPNRAAQSLRGQRTNVVGIYAAPGYLNPQVGLTAQIIGGLHRGCDERERDLLLHGSYRGRSVEDLLAQLNCGSVDGMVLYTAPSDPIVAALNEAAVPVVGIVDALPGTPSVVADDAQGARLIAERIAARTPGRPVIYRAGSLTLVSAERRQKAFVAAATERGLSVTVSAPPTVDWHERFADREVEELLAMGRNGNPATVVCWNDLTAYDLLGHCARRGVRIPHDIAVAGFDDLPAPRPSSWRLTTVRAPWVQVAQTAVELLIRRLDGVHDEGNAGVELPIETVLPVTLVCGDTL